MVLLLVVITPPEPCVWMPMKPPAVVALVPDPSMEPTVLFWMLAELVVTAMIPATKPLVPVVAL